MKPVSKNQQCPSCPRRFSAEQGLKVHMGRMHKASLGLPSRSASGHSVLSTKTCASVGGSNECSICRKTFSLEKGLRMHIAKMHTKRSRSSSILSTRSFTLPPPRAKQAASVSARTVASSVGGLGLEFQCSLCPKSFGRERSLRSHVTRSHKASLGEQALKFKCPVCDKFLCSSSSLKEHVRSIHEGIKSYNCGLCVKAFNRPGALCLHFKKVHKLDATGQSIDTEEALEETTEEQFHCPVCARDFLTENQMQLHTQLVHKLKCGQCEQVFRDKEKLAEHTRKWHWAQCQECARTFSSRAVLDAHLREAHHNWKFVCPVCSKKFLFNHRLEDHLRNAHGTRSFTCDQCSGRDFHNRDGYRRHLWQRHGIRIAEPDPDSGSSGPVSVITLEEEASGEATEIGEGAERKREIVTEKPVKKLIKKEATKRATESRDEVLEARADAVQDLSPPADSPFLLPRSQVPEEPLKSKSGRMQCHLCHKNYTSKGHLKEHIAVVHHSFKKFKCNHCDRGFQRRGIYISHLNKAHNDFQTELEIPKRWQKPAQSLDEQPAPAQAERVTKATKALLKRCKNIKKEPATEQGMPKIRCRLCPSWFFYKSNLEIHMKSVHESLKCSLCPRTFKDQAGLHKHVQEDHEQPGQKAGLSKGRDGDMQKFKCKICYKLFIYKFNLKAHIRKAHKDHDRATTTHSKPVQVKKEPESDEISRLQCKICFKTFGHEASLKAHGKIHKNLKCSFCPMTFRVKPFLENHIRTTHKVPEKSAEHAQISGHGIEESSDHEMTGQDDHHEASTEVAEDVGLDNGDISLEEDATNEVSELMKLDKEIIEYLLNDEGPSDHNECETAMELSDGGTEEQTALDRDQNNNVTTPYKAPEETSTEATSNNELSEELEKSKEVVSNLFRCGACSKPYAFMSNLISHVKMVHADPEKFKCHLCSRGFRRRVGLMCHLGILHKGASKPDKAAKDIKIEPSVDVNNHSYKEEAAEEEDYSTEEAPTQDIKTEPATDVHIPQGIKTEPSTAVIKQEEDPPSPTDQLQCSMCSKSYQYKANLNTHMKMVHGGFQCHMCLKQYRRKGMLLKHLQMVHKQKKPSKRPKTVIKQEPEQLFACKLCSLSFSHLSALHSHEDLVHGPSQRFYCSACSRIYSDKVTLQDHMSKYHGEASPAAAQAEEKKLLRCKMCLESFQTKAEILDHMMEDHVDQI